MGALSKVAASVALLALAGCGSGGGDPEVVPGYKYAAPAGQVSYLYNPSHNPVTVEVGGEVPPTKKTGLLAAGDTYAPLPPAAPITIERCEPVEGSEVRVCWPTGWEGAAQYLLGKMPEVLTKVKSFGDPGQVDVVVGSPEGYAYAGEYRSQHGVVFVETLRAGDGWLKGTAIHELAHAAFYKATKTEGPSWLNEAMATLAEETRYDVAKSQFDGLDITAFPATYEGYVRVHAVGLLLKALNPGLSADAVSSALKSGDVIKGLTGLDTPAFSKFFWQKYKTRQPVAAPGRQVIPPYTAITVNSEVQASGPLETL